MATRQLFPNFSPLNPSTKAFTAVLVSDTGGPQATSTTFYYNPGSKGGGYNSFSPGPDAVSELTRKMKPSDVFGIGDLAYNAGGSTMLDGAIGQYYNNYLYPYPAKAYLRYPYTTFNGRLIQFGNKSWPYNIYNFPQGFPNPETGGRGGSPDSRNHFWASLGNHDYGRFLGYGQVGLTPYTYDGTNSNAPIGTSSTGDVQAFVDYLTPYLLNPALLSTEDRLRLNIGAVDTSGNRGVYYSISRGGTVNQPLVEFFMLDTERLNINSGSENWNPTGDRIKEGNKYVNQVPKAKGAEGEQQILSYDPSDPTSLARSGTTTDPDNGYDQFIWLKKALAASKATWKVITGHHPVYGMGRWKDEQPDDHMSNAYLQRLLKALPKGSFAAYYNGHTHGYERVMETNGNGIGLGIPFITNGNSGRNLEQVKQTTYGGLIYEPQGSGTANPDQKAIPYMLASAPVLTGKSGLSGNGSAANNGFSNGIYGYGFGATKLDATKDYLLFHYQETALSDPAIANHLPGAKQAEAGFSGTTAADWTPTTFNGIDDLARINLTVENGVVTAAEVLPGQGGRGYMSSKNGNFVVKGFNVYGNNVDMKQPWLNTAQLDLTFEQGVLTKVNLTDGGMGYQLAAASASDNNAATSTNKLVIGIDYNIEETQYLVRDTALNNDWHMSTNTQSRVDLLGQPGQPGQLRVSITPNSQEAIDLLTGKLAPTSGYSGTGAQRFGVYAQDGDITVRKNGAIIAQGNLDNGTWVGAVSALPSASEPLTVSFAGDPISSYNVNFMPSVSTAIVTADLNGTAFGTLPWL